jgi:hypothetical protein
MGVGFGAVSGALIGGFVASKMTATPANKRILYSGIIQMGAGFMLRKRWPGIALGMIASGAVNVVAIAMAAAPNSLLDGSKGSGITAAQY